MSNKKTDLREILKDAHAHFYILKGEGAERLAIWEILDDSIIIDIPTGAPMRRTVLGFIPSLAGNSIYEIEGTVNQDAAPNQMNNTLRIAIGPGGVKKVNHRLFQRYSFTPPLEAKVTISPKHKKIAGRIINLSASGLRVEVPDQLAPDHECVFEFDIEIDDEVHSLRLEGMIVYEIPLDMGYAYGVQLGNIDEDKKMLSTDEAPVKELDLTVDLMSLVNRLIIRGEGQEE